MRKNVPGYEYLNGIFQFIFWNFVKLNELCVGRKIGTLQGAQLSKTQNIVIRSDKVR